MKVYRITGAGLCSQVHCVVAKSMEEAARLWKLKYISDPEGIELYAEYVITAYDFPIEAPKDGSGKTVPMGMLVALAKHGSESYRKDDYYDRETDLTEIAVRYGYTVTESAKEEGR